jgi:hypothetical protein
MVTRNPQRGAVSSPDPDDRNAAPPAGDQGGNWPQDFHDAAAEYVTALAQISSRLQEKQKTALEGLSQISPDATRSTLTEDLANVYRDLIDAIQKQDAQKIKSVQSDYLSRVQSAYGEAETNLKNRQTEYVNTHLLALQNAKTELSAAFQAYIDAVQSSFAKLPATTDPAAVVAIGQSLATIASYAYNAAQAMAVLPNKS